MTRHLASPSRSILLLAVMTGVAGAADAPPSPGRVALERIAVEALRVNPNLLTNVGFEETPAGSVIPTGWNWDHRNTDATCRTDAGAARSGLRSLHITNGTPFGAHVYGTLWRAQPVRVKVGRPYTMSAWVNSDAPGMVSLVGGDGWQFRASAVSTGGQWKRIAATFTPGEKDREFTLRINTESPTPGARIDDIKLEEGPEATPDPPTGSAASKLILEPDQAATEIQGDGPFRTSFTCWAPAAASGTVELKLSSGEVLSSTVQLAAGFQHMVVAGTSSAASNAPRSVVLRLTVQGGDMAEAHSLLRFHSAANALERVAALKAALPGMRKKLESLGAPGRDFSYPRVSLAVLDEFVVHAADDARHGEVKLALREVGEMEEMATRLTNDLSRGLEGERGFPPVPRWTANERPTVRGSSFLATVRWPDGSEVKRPVFFTGYGHFGRVVSDMEKWPELGANIIQIELGSPSVFPREGVTDDAPVRRVVGILDRARKSGVAVCLLISPHYFPDWALNKWPHLRKHRDGFLQYCLHAPEGQELLRRFVATTVGPLKDHPALHSICLSNEPVNQEEPCDFARTDWHNWLRQRHGDLAQLNRRYGTNYKSFTEVPLPDPFRARPALPVWIDYVRFNQEFFAHWHALLADAVHRAAPGVPVHAKAMTWTFLNDGDVAYGVDATLFGSFSDINGNDAVNFHGSGLEEFAQGWQSNAMGHDLQRSVRDAPVFNTENHIIVDRETRDVPPEHVRSALWQAAVHGQSATTIWVWDRTRDPRSDFAGSILERPACVEAVGIVGHDLNRAAIEVTALQQARPQVLLLHSTSSLVWDTGRHTECRGQLYAALVFSGLKVGFITERQLEQGKVPDAPVVFAPDVVHLSDPAASTLRKFPGKLVLVGANDVLGRDDYGQSRAGTFDAEQLEWRYSKNSWRDLWRELPARLAAWNVRPAVELRTRGGERPWGVEWCTVSTPGGLIVNLCNERNDAVTLTMTRGQGGGPFRDVLTGEPVRPALTLKPLEVRLLRQEHQ